jgi:hypothetical protein
MSQAESAIDDPHGAFPDQPSVKRTAVAGRKIAQTRVYFKVSTGEAVHIHRLAAAVDETGEEKHLRDAVDLFDRWVRNKHDEELEYIAVDETDIDHEGPIYVDLNSRSLSFGRHLSQ